MLKKEISEGFRLLLKQTKLHQATWNRDNWDSFLIMSPLVWRQVIIALGIKQMSIGELKPYTLSTRNGLVKRIATMVEAGVLKKETRPVKNNLGRTMNVGFYSVVYTNLARFAENCSIENYVDFSAQDIRRIVFNRLEPEIKLLVEQLINNKIVKVEMEDNIEPLIGALFQLIDQEHTSNVTDEIHEEY